MVRGALPGRQRGRQPPVRRAAPGRRLADRGHTLSTLLDEYADQCTRTNEIIAAHALDEPGRHPDHRAAAASLRWMVIHMIEETARRAGHLDTVREWLDGRKGYY